MKQGSKIGLYVSLCLLAAFVLWTVLVSTVDVQAIGPQESRVGLATLNAWAHDLTGLHMTLYTLTDWLGLVPVGTACGFAVWGFCQWIRRRRLAKVDFGILAMGVFYLAVMAVYLLFEVTVVNHRPVLIEGRLEASYPSSTTVLASSVMPAALVYLWRCMRGKALRIGIAVGIVGFTVFMVIGRLVSGVHWVSDVIGGGLISAGLVTLYAWVTRGRR